MKYPNAAKGIKKIYIAEILNISAVVLAIGILIMLAAGKVYVSIGGGEATQAQWDAKIFAQSSSLVSG